ncbi:MAG: hypothetical protein KJN65_02345 [Croceitalea sp.]|nr:hypothetical protein [Croceitalea sp.]
MKFVRFIPLLTVLIFANCKMDKKQEVSTPINEPTVLDKIALAHGFDQWNNVAQISFTFNVDRDSNHFERAWVWNTMSNEVTHISGTDTLVYNRRQMDSTALKTNAEFINDRYWLMAPFNLIWDQGNFTYTHTEAEIAPISKKPMQKLTIVYGTDGGYTPGDAYDLYFEDDFLIREWVFRKTNQEEPSLTTTWEDYIDHQGFNFALSHKKANEDFNIYFDDVTIIKKQ